MFVLFFKYFLLFFSFLFPFSPVLFSIQNVIKDIYQGFKLRYWASCVVFDRGVLGQQEVQNGGRLERFKLVESSCFLRR